MVPTTICEHLLCTRGWAFHKLSHLILTTTQLVNTSKSPFCRCRNWGTEKKSSWPEIMQSGNAGARIWTQDCGFRTNFLLPLNVNQWGKNLSLLWANLWHCLSCTDRTYQLQRSYRHSKTEPCSSHVKCPTGEQGYPMLFLALSLTCWLPFPSLNLILESIKKANFFPDLYANPNHLVIC